VLGYCHEHQLYLDDDGNCWQCKRERLAGPYELGQALYWIGKVAQWWGRGGTAADLATALSMIGNEIRQQRQHRRSSAITCRMNEELARRFGPRQLELW
jgi:hypothetical protein